VPVGQAATAVAVNAAGTCIINTHGQVECWGTNKGGRLGLGAIVEASPPTVVTLPANAAHLAFGQINGCAILVDGRLYCWGENTGNAGAVTSDVPVAVDLGDELAVSVKRSNAGGCVETSLDRVYCWGGSADAFRLGTPGYYLTPHPSKISDGQRLWTISRDSSASCSVSNSGTMSCTGEEVTRLSPEPSPAATAVKSLSVKGTRSCAVLEDDTVRCWGRKPGTWLGLADTDTFTQTAGIWTVPNLRGISAVEPYGGALDQAGKLYGWGDNLFGQIGDGTTESKATPTLLTLAPPSVVEIRRSGGHGCVRDAAGYVYCWGRNESSQCSGLSMSVQQPTLVPDLSGVVQLATGSDHSCALKDDGTVWCWGANAYAQVAASTGIVTTPMQIQGLSEIVALSAEAWWSCALSRAGQVYCWGMIQGDTSVPTSYRVSDGPVSGIKQAVQLEVGDSSACALESSGELLCWGANLLGELGAGTTDNSFRQAQPVLGLANVTLFGVGESFACAVLKGGQGYCWGADRGEARLGDLSTLDPAPVSGIGDTPWSVGDW
jgi:alpha-tubulin suppressor-like RCC1 family protein